MRKNIEELEKRECMPHAEKYHQTQGLQNPERRIYAITQIIHHAPADGDTGKKKKSLIGDAPPIVKKDDKTKRRDCCNREPDRKKIKISYNSKCFHASWVLYG